MYFQKSLRIVAALSLICSTDVAYGCPNGKDWKDLSAISLSSENATLLTLKRFVDGIYAKVESEKGVKETYQLNSGIHLYRGFDMPEKKGPSPFFMLDMPVGMALNFLAQHFKLPCSVDSTQTSFASVNPSGKSTINVSGSAYRVRETAIVFDVRAIEQREHGAKIKMSGTIEFSDIAALPGDTVISDWVIVRGSEIAVSKTEVKPIQLIRTIKDLKNLSP
jgi:hypothetical protein